MRLFNHTSHLEKPVSDRPAVPADKIATHNVQIERKTFVFQLQENIRGRFLRIIEEGNGRRTSIVIPATGLVEFKRLLEDVAGEAAVPAMPRYDEPARTRP